MPNLTMPNVGEGVAEGTVTHWLKQEGDVIALDEPVVEVETDKAVVEIPSPFEGTLTKILVEEGATVPIGAPLAEFETTGTKQATMEEPAKADSAPLVGAPRSARTERAPSRVSQRATNGAAPASPPPRRHRQFSPVVLKLAAEHDIDLALVRGTGIEGRVTRQDVLAYIENPVAHTVAPAEGEGVVGARPKPAAEASKSSTATPPSAPESAPSDERVPLTPTRRTIAQRMLQSHQTVPVAWMVVEADVSGLVAVRERAKEEFQRREGVALSYMPFFVQAIVGALKQHPEINATFDDDAIVVHRRCDIGIAVAAESGLVVPVIRDADRKSIVGLAHELDDLGAKARARKLTVDDMRNATFTIDNTGAFGSVVSQPIVPPGQAAIITTEAIRRELCATGDASFAVRSVMNLCISFDHRALDGAQAGAFMRDVKLTLEAFTPDQRIY